MQALKLVRQISKYVLESPSNKGQKVYRLFLALGWQLYKRAVGLPIISKLDNGAHFILLPNSTNSTGNIYVKTYEAEYIYFLRKEVIEGGVFLDIGAHMGLYTLLLKDKFKKGFCFEPAKDNYKALKNNLFINNLHENFIALDKAVSNVEGTSVFNVNGDFSGTNSLEDAGAGSSGQEVETITIDSFIRKNGIQEKIQLIKIDTEGHEMQVLEGAKETLQNSPTCIVVIENYDTEIIIDFFNKLSYTVYALNKEGVISDEKEKVMRTYNLLAIGPLHPISLNRTLA
jgi:FkbM family methyltransferase